MVKLGTDVFSLVLTNGDILHSGEFKLVGEPRVVAAAGQSRCVAFFRAAAGPGTGRRT